VGVSPISCQFYSTLNPQNGVSDDVSDFILLEDRQLVDNCYVVFQLIGGTFAISPAIVAVFLG
jgi:hypothetical protein